MTTDRPILVTGSHRSGTTWVGRTLAEAPGVHYIHEPFSVSDPPGPGVCNAAFNHWYTRIDSGNDAQYFAAFHRMLAHRYDLAAALRSTRRLSDLRRVAVQQASFMVHRTRGSRALVKDPIAFFSAEWLARRFDMDVVVLIRHPAAFASSLKKLGWQHPFHHFLEQSSFVQGVMLEFEPEIRLFARSERSIVDQAILLWRMVHRTILDYRQRHPEWTFLRHEDISREPHQQFEALFRRLGLQYTERARQSIAASSNRGNPWDPGAPVGSAATLRRDSRANVGVWRTRLTPAEIDTIHRQVEDISGHFYASDEW